MDWTAARIALALIGIGGLFASVRALQAARATRRWTVVSGKVVQRTTAHVTAANLGSPFYQHTPLVRYRYVVDGQSLTGAAWYPPAVHHPPRGSFAWAEAQARRVPDVVAVHVNPERPTESYLFAAPERPLAVVAAVSGLLAACAVVV